MDSGEAELYFNKKKFDKEEVNKRIETFPLKEYWKVEDNPREFIAKFRPPKLKILKQFRKLN